MRRILSLGEYKYTQAFDVALSFESIIQVSIERAKTLGDHLHKKPCSTLSTALTAPAIATGHASSPTDDTIHCMNIVNMLAGIIVLNMIVIVHRDGGVILLMVGVILSAQ